MSNMPRQERAEGWSGKSDSENDMAPYVIARKLRADQLF